MMAEETFVHWLEQQADRQDPVGVIARWFRDDACWTRPGWTRPQAPGEIDDHLSFHRASTDLVAGMREAWREWGRPRGEVTP